MEHLLYTDEITKLNGVIVPTPWLGYNHGGCQIQYPAVHLDDYALNRGWTTEQLNQLLASTDAFGLSGLALLQSMATFGIWEAIFARRLPETIFLRGYSPGADIDTSMLPPMLNRFRPQLEKSE